MSGPGARPGIDPDKLLQPSPDTVSNHRTTNLFCHGKAKPAWLSRIILNTVAHLHKEMPGANPARFCSGLEVNSALDALNPDCFSHGKSRPHELSGRKTLASACAPCGKYLAPTFGRHARTESVSPFADQSTWLECTFHCQPPPVAGRLLESKTGGTTPATNACI